MRLPYKLFSCPRPRCRGYAKRLSRRLQRRYTVSMEIRRVAISRAVTLALGIWDLVLYYFGSWLT